MATTILTYVAKSLDSLLLQVNADLALLLADSFTACSFDARDESYNKDYRLVIQVESGGAVIVNPMVMVAFDSGSLQGSGLALQNYIAANPTYFVSIPYVGNLTGGGGGGRTLRNPILVATNIVAADGAAVWFASGAAPLGVAGGDLAGFYPNPTVAGIEGNPIGPFGVAGQMLVIGDGGASLVWYSTRVYTSLALAAADQANQVIGQQIIIYNAVPTAEDGTYQLTVKTAAPADYTKISDATNTAAEVSIVDAGGYYTSTNVEGALQELGASAGGAQQSIALPIATTPEQLFPFATTESVEVEFTLTKAAVRYVSLVRATHDGVTAYWSEANTVVSPGVVDASVSFDIVGANLRFLATAASAGWTLRWIVRKLTT